MSFRIPTPSSSSAWPGLKVTGRILWHTLKRFESEERRRDAAALTYTTLFALVPVITVTYAILSAIPSLQNWGQEIHGEMLSYLMPEGSGAVSDYLVQFSQQARKLTWVGVLFLFITAFLLLRTIEMQFNKIWNVEKPRSGLQTFLRYWAVLSLGPVLLGAALAASSLIASLPLWSNFASVPFAVRILPWAMSVGAVTAVYILVPNCRVPWRHALIAGVVVATIFEAGKFIFARAVGLFPSYQLIYGAFAAVPLFLLWIYLAWMLLLLGAELSFSLSHHRARARLTPLLWQRLRLVQVLWSRQQQGLTNDEASLTEALPDLSAEEVNTQLAHCQQHGWTALTQDQQWVWLRDVRLATVGELLTDLTLAQLQQSLPDYLHVSAELQPLWDDWQAHWSSRLQLPLAALLCPDITSA